MTRALDDADASHEQSVELTENAGGDFWAILTQFPAHKTQIRSCRMDKSSGPHPSAEDLLINSNLNSNLILGKDIILILILEI